ncbi:MAG: leucyl aminopeptidase family protein, partial [Planctomycetota bacterium]
WLIDQRISTAALWLDGLLSSDLEHPAGHWADGMTCAGFCYDEFKNSDTPSLKRIRIVLRGSDNSNPAARLKEIRPAVTLARAVNFARRLGHAPANELYPMAMAAEARSLARRLNLQATVLKPAELKRRRMNGILAVGQGAEHEPCLIRLDYNGAKRVRPRVVVIGKAVTFDTGGYSLKDKQGLEGLKFDKCGGAAALGIARAVAELGLPCNMTVLTPAAENAIGSRAYRPGDIIRMMNGTTVEIISTDAEGRLILADALTYAQRHCNPTVMIDLATLTGGVVITLGKAAAGLMANDDDLAAQLEECGRVTDERLWRLPLWDEYRDLIRGNDSDIRNSSGKRHAHAIVGGMFLREFIEQNAPWAHIDIAGVATDEAGVAATGFGVRLVVEYLRRRFHTR